ncbi:hypothetical protein [Adlercreutzia aquisgranensis]|uniref:hypothetical protein n=1 Tax=Adlercreutzia aquisgranensis TaxID=2941323 RepID=UPI00203A67CB|nr:hypothetical protein [Adlercreutzia aquisgranensis]
MGESAVTCKTDACGQEHGDACARNELRGQCSQAGALWLEREAERDRQKLLRDEESHPEPTVYSQGGEKGGEVSRDSEAHRDACDIGEAR